MASQVCRAFSLTEFQARRSRGVVIINPGVNDHLGRSVVPKKQAVLLEEFGAEPVFLIIAQRAPLSVFSAGGVLRDDIKGQAGNGGQLLGGVLLDIARWGG